MMVYYIVLRGIDKFQAEYNSYPGEFDEHVEPDIVKLKVNFLNILLKIYLINSRHKNVIVLISGLHRKIIQRMGMRATYKR